MEKYNDDATWQSILWKLPKEWRRCGCFYYLFEENPPRQRIVIAKHDYDGFHWVQGITVVGATGIPVSSSSD